MLLTPALSLTRLLHLTCDVANTKTAEAPMNTSRQLNKKQLDELLYQALETEIGGISVYENAIACALNNNLRKEWNDYLDETRNHREILLQVFAEIGLDPAKRTPGRNVLKHIAESLVVAMQMARTEGSPEAAQLVACECVINAETKDHMNWELIGKCAKDTDEPNNPVLLAAYEKVEPDEDHHLYHTKGWARELWIESLGMPAVIPPPEELRQVETAIGAAKAGKARTNILHAQGKL